MKNIESTLPTLTAFEGKYEDKMHSLQIKKPTFEIFLSNQLFFENFFLYTLDQT